MWSPCFGRRQMGSPTRPPKPVHPCEYFGPDRGRVGVTMPEPYPIVEVSPEWVLGPEEMGSKEKFWYYNPEKETAWLFKHPQDNTGQHWAEKISAEVASRLGMFHAKVELAEFQGKRGSTTESFSRGGRELVHGNQMLERVVRGYDPRKTFNQSSHTLTNIWCVMERVFPAAEGARQAKLRFADHLVLDALIGNTDRHHENWGILRRRVGDRWRGFVAPSFDHASSLGRELRDSDRDRRLKENRVGDYLQRGRGAIFWSEGERHGPSPLELVKRASRTRPDLFRPALEKLARLDERSLSDLVNRVPDDWMTSSARAFAVVLMGHSLSQLGELTQ